MAILQSCNSYNSDCDGDDENCNNCSNDCWGEEGSVEVISTLGSGFIVEGGSVIEVTLFGVMAVVVGLAVGGGRHSSSFRVYKCKNHSTE